MFAGGGSVRVGCASGVDAAVRSCCPSAVVVCAAPFSGSPRLPAAILTGNLLCVHEWYSSRLDYVMLPRSFSQSDTNIPLIRAFAALLRTLDRRIDLKNATV